MKKLLIAVLLMNGIALSATAQKFMTRTGKVTFFSSTPLENIEAYNNQVAGVIDAKTGDVAFIVPIKGFRFEKALMQEHFNENYMESDKYPKADLKGTIANLKDVDFNKDGNYSVKINGKLTIHGVTRNVTLPGTITVKGDNITASSKFSARTADYDIKIPSLVAGKIANEIEVTVNSILKKM
jgi:hypothetical protein